MKETNNMLYQRIKGILIGGALGDAMGMPTELWSQEMIKIEYPGGIDIGEFKAPLNKGSIVRDMKAGQITDDTINIIFLIEMLDKTNGEISVENYLKQLRKWNNDSELADLVSGPSTRKALELIDKGVSINETGRFGTTNGAAMKIAPIGLISDFNRMSELVNNVYQICLPTHNTSIAIGGACGIATAISYVSSGGRSINRMISLAMQGIKLGNEKGYQVSSPSLVWRINNILSIVDSNSEEYVLNYLYNFLGTNVETIDTIPAIFGIIKLSNGNPYESSRLAANLGGDTDTIGAIATSICGGLFPEFNKGTISQLEEVNGIDFDSLTKKIIQYSPYYKF